MGLILREIDERQSMSAWDVVFGGVALRYRRVDRLFSRFHFQADLVRFGDAGPATVIGEIVSRMKKVKVAPFVEEETVVTLEGRQVARVSHTDGERLLHIEDVGAWRLDTSADPDLSFRATRTDDVSIGVRQTRGVFWRARDQVALLSNEATGAEIARAEVYPSYDAWLHGPSRILPDRLREAWFPLPRLIRSFDEDAQRAAPGLAALVAAGALRNCVEKMWRASD